LFFSGSLGIGCKEEPPAPIAVKKKVAPVKTEPVPGPAPAVKSSAADTDPTGLMPLMEPDAGRKPVEAVQAGKRRDPFRSFIQVKSPGAAVRKKPARRLTPLQKYSLDQLRVVGVIGGGSLRKALLEDDVGKGYVVGVGDAVGNQGGTIVVIKPDRIVIKEIHTDALGEDKVRRITKRLYAVKKDGYQ